MKGRQTDLIKNDRNEEEDDSEENMKKNLRKLKLEVAQHTELNHFVVNVIAAFVAFSLLSLAEDFPAMSTLRWESPATCDCNVPVSPISRKSA